MKVYVLHFDEDTQVCSTMKKAIDAAKKAVTFGFENGRVDFISVHNDYAEIRYMYRFSDDDIYYERAWIYPYEIDGGPFIK